MSEFKEIAAEERETKYAEAAELEGYFPTKEGRACGQWYWLRGHGWSMLSPMAIYTDGTLYEYGVNKNSDEVGVRPAMWVRKKIL